jgi:hypothetical protein
MRQFPDAPGIGKRDRRRTCAAWKPASLITPGDLSSLRGDRKTLSIDPRRLLGLAFASADLLLEIENGQVTWRWAPRRGSWARTSAP